MPVDYQWVLFRLLNIGDIVILIRQFFPIICLCFSWLLVLAVRNTFFLDFESISSDAGLYLLLFFGVAVFGYLGGSLIAVLPKVGNGGGYNPRSVNVKANWLIFFALVSIVFALAKFYHASGFSEFSLNMIAEYRMQRARDEGDIKGGSVFGIISNITSAFIVVVYIYSVYFKSCLSRRKTNVMRVVFFWGLAVSFLGGGRFSAAIAVLFVFLFTLCSHIYVPKARVAQLPLPRSGFGWGSKAVVIVLLIVLFSYMFIARFSADGRGNEMILDYLNSGLPGVSVPDSIALYLGDSSFGLISYFVLALFLYYIGHSFYQFDVLLSYGMPESAPYVLAYQLYPFALLSNKFGFEIISIETILEQLPNAGTYFSLAGAFYLDFGYWGAFIAVFLLFFIGALVWGWMLRKGSFLSIFFSSMFMVIVLSSPIVGIIGTAIYPSLIAVSFFLWIFVPARFR